MRAQRIAADFGTAILGASGNNQSASDAGSGDTNEIVSLLHQLKINQVTTR
jgi:hypothetical protein